MLFIFIFFGACRFFFFWRCLSLLHLAACWFCISKFEYCTCRYQPFFQNRIWIKDLGKILKTFRGSTSQTIALHRGNPMSMFFLPFVFESLQMFPKSLGFGLQFINIQVINVKWLTTFGKNLLLTITFGTTTLLSFWIFRIIFWFGLRRCPRKMDVPCFGPCLTLSAARAAFFLSASSRRFSSSWAAFFSFSIFSRSWRAFSAWNYEVSASGNNSIVEFRLISYKLWPLKWQLPNPDWLISKKKNIDPLTCLTVLKI